MRARAWLSAATPAAALAVALVPGPAHAVPPALLVSVGSSLGIPLGALVLALVLVLARRLGLWALGLGRVLVVLTVAGGLGLAMWLALAPRSVWLPCDLHESETQARFEISAERLAPAGPARMPLLDLRRRRDFRASSVPGSIHLGVPPSESTARPETLALAHALLRLRGLALSRQESAGELALSCYAGCTAQSLVPGLREAGLQAWAVHQGWGALRRFQPTSASDWAAVPPLRTVDPATADQWVAAKTATPVPLDEATLRRWMAAAPGSITAELGPELDTTLLLNPPDGALISILAARLLDEPGLPPVVWRDDRRPAAWAPLRVLRGLGLAAERAAGPALWIVLALLAGAVPVAREWRGPTRVLAREQVGPTGAAAGAGAVLLLALLSGASPTQLGLPSAAKTLLPALLAGAGAALATATDRDTRLRWALQRAGGDGLLWRVPWHALALAVLVGIATAGLVAELSLPVALAATSALLLPPAIDLLRAGRWRAGAGRGRAATLSRLAALVAPELRPVPPGAPLRSRHPAIPGAVSIGAGAPAVGLLTGTTPSGEIHPEGRALARLARAAGHDLEWSAAGPPTPLPAAPRSPAALLHDQILHLPPALVGHPAARLDAARLSEAAAAPTRLTADLLRRRTAPGGGALRAARLLGIPRAPTPVVRLGTRLYDVLGESAVPTGGLLRWTGPAAAELATRLALGHHLRQTLRRMARAGEDVKGLLSALEALPAEGAFVPELVGLIGLAAGPGRDHGPPPPAQAHALGPGGPRDRSLPPLPTLPEPLADRMATLRGWLRHLAAAEIATLRAALDARARAIGWGAEVYALTLSELRAVLTGTAAERAPLQTVARRRVDDDGMLASTTAWLPSRLRVSELESLSLRAPPALGTGLLVAGTGPATGQATHGHPTRGQVVICGLPAPADLVRWHRAGAAGVVCEEGGTLSHVAVLARELGLPVVVGLGGARHGLPAGATVCIGTDGTVTVREPPASAPAPPPPPALLSLDQATPAHGGKACMLGRLVGQGLRVPAGLVVPPARLAAARSVSPPDRGAAATLDALAEQILGHSVLAGGDDLIVRSSARGEDGAGSSFAGLLASRRCPAQQGPLAAALADCAAAADRPDLDDYLDLMGIPGPVSLGLVVQRYVAATLGGVLFTVGPQDPAPWVEVSSGGAEGTVAGRPDRYRGPLASATALPPSLHAALLALCPVAERVVGGPADIEWVWADDLWVVQARPITGR